MNEAFNDTIGQELQLGDWVAYGTRSAEPLHVGKIVKLEFVEKMDGGYWDYRVKAVGNWTVSIPEQDRMVRIENQDDRLGDQL